MPSESAESRIARALADLETETQARRADLERYRKERERALAASRARLDETRAAILRELAASVSACRTAERATRETLERIAAGPTGAKSARRERH